MAQTPDDVILEGVKAADEAEKRRCPDDLYVNLTIRRVKRSFADQIINAAADITGRVEVSMDTAGPQMFRKSDG